jgi:glycosyltransferase involved in cell wall biosynthesis
MAMAGAAARAPLKVSVLVDLLHRPDAGGHVKTWQRLARAAVGLGAELDLTVHFAAEDPGLVLLGDNVRFRLHPPRFSTARLPFLRHIPDHTDLARYHRELARHLLDADVLHTTDAYFAFAHTAERVARRRGVPLVSSVHTDTPSYTRVFAAEIIYRLFGRGWLARLLVERAGFPRRAEAWMLRRLRRHQQHCAAALVSRPGELAAAAARLPRGQARLLRRGIDHQLFSPARRDRAWLERAFHVPPDRVVVLFVGRLSQSKNLLMLADVVRAMVDASWPVHLICAGQGSEREAIAARLGAAVTCAGILEPSDLARVYASVDLVAHPSEIEEWPNVVLEALASGAALAVAEEIGRAQLVVDGQTGVVVRGATAGAWAQTLVALVDRPELRARLGAAARRWAIGGIPSWRDVLVQDLLPVWSAVRAQERQP